jgi:transposase
MTAHDATTEDIMAVLGLDISKIKIHAALRTDADKLRHKTTPNTPAGFRELLAWARRYAPDALHACLEATGTYGDGVAQFLHDAGCAVSIINPAAMRAYAASQLSRTKTDDIDAALIAHFAATQQPPIWTPSAPEIRVLQALVRRLDALLEMRTQEVNRLAAGVVVSEVRASIEGLLANLEAQIAHVRQLIRDHIDRHPDLRQQRELLTTIPGIGESTAATLIAELFDKPYLSARQAAAFAGVVPRIRQSGQWRGRPRLSKIGPSRLRKALFFPALTALRCNPTIRASVARLRAEGRPKMVIVGAAMRRLVHLAFGVLKSGRAYKPQGIHA